MFKLYLLQYLLLFLLFYLFLYFIIYLLSLITVSFNLSKNSNSNNKLNTYNCCSLTSLVHHILLLLFLISIQLNNWGRSWSKSHLRSVNTYKTKWIFIHGLWHLNHMWWNIGINKLISFLRVISNQLLTIRVYNLRMKILKLATRFSNLF